MGTYTGGIMALRAFSRTSQVALRRGMSSVPSAADASVKITFANRATGERWTEEGVVGQTLLRLAQNKCIGMRAAGTHGMNVHSHIIVQQDWEDKLPISEEAAMVLDDIPHTDLTPGSRLACQIVLTKAMDGMNVAVPL